MYRTSEKVRSTEAALGHNLFSAFHHAAGSAVQRVIQKRMLIIRVALAFDGRNFVGHFLRVE